MSPLSLAALGLGTAAVLLGAIPLWRPDWAARAAAAFPRHRGAGRILAGIDLLWIAIIIYQAPLGRFEYLKYLPARLLPLPAPWLEGISGFFFQTPLWAALAAWWIVVRALDDLLAPRALGGLLLLAANPMLVAARWHESPWRLVVTVLAYVLVVQGIWLVLSPFRFRMAMSRIMTPRRRARAAGACGVALGLLLAGLALGAY